MEFRVAASPSDGYVGAPIPCATAVAPDITALVLLMRFRFHRFVILTFVPVFAACVNHTRALQPVAAATEFAIRQARMGLDSAVHSGASARIMPFLADSFAANVAGVDFTRATWAAAYDQVTGGRVPATLTITPGNADYCLAGGFETGRFTFATSANEASRNGTYALAWASTDGVARVARLMLDTARDTRRMRGALRCQTWKSQRLRGSPLLLSVTPVYDRTNLQSKMYADAQAAGWKNGYIDGTCSEWHGESDYANPESAPDRSSSIHYDGLGVLLGARLRVGERSEIEVQGAARETSSCSVGLNRSRGTVLTTFMRTRWYGAYYSRFFGDLRIGLGPTMRSVAASAGNFVPADSVDKMLFGLGTVIGYTVPMGQSGFADLNARVGMGSSFTMPAGAGYTPKPVRPLDVLVGVSLGWSR
jgi:hypothetical protein